MFGLSIFARNYLATRFLSEPRQGGDSPTLPALRRYVFTMSISGALVTPALWLGTSSLLKYSGEATVAMFNIINQWRSAALLVSNTYNTSIIPSFARITAKGAFQRSLLRSTATTLLAVSVPSACIFAAWPWTAHLYGISATEGMYAVSGLLICNLFAALLNFSGTILSVTGNPKTNLLINGIWLVTYFTLLSLNKPITLDHFVFDICLATILVSLLSMTLAFFQNTPAKTA